MTNEEVPILGCVSSSAARPVQDLVVYKKRFVVLSVYSLESFVFLFLWYGFISISKDIQVQYDVSASSVNLLTNVGPFFMVPVTFVSFYTNGKSVKNGINFGTLCLLISGWLRYFGAGHYWMLLLGQSILAVGLPFILNLSTEVVENWFSTESKGSALTCAIIFQYLGTILAFLIPPIFLSSFSNGMEWFLLFQAVLCTLCCLATFLLFEAHPPTPPSYDHSRSFEKFSVNQSLLMILKNKNFVFLVIVIALAYGIFSCLPVLLPQILCPIGYTNEEIGIAGAAILVVGILGCFILELVWVKLQKFTLLVFKIATLLNLMIFAFFIISLKPGNSIFIYSSLSLLGFFTLPLLPLALNLAADMTYPVAENISNGLVLALGNVCAFVMTMVFEHMQNPITKSMDRALYSMFGVMALVLFIGTFLNYEKPRPPSPEEEAAEINRRYYYNTVQVDME
eukprot:Nk52_evm36s208 gene=Nk52_evmTU36s208